MPALTHVYPNVSIHTLEKRQWYICTVNKREYYRGGQIQVGSVVSCGGIRRPIAIASAIIRED